MNRADIEKVLVGHQYLLPLDKDGTVVCTCSCDRSLRFTDREHNMPLGESGHRAHIADQLMPLLAAVWDEGYRGSGGDHARMFDPEDSCDEPHRPNPYRMEATD